MSSPQQLPCQPLANLADTVQSSSVQNQFAQQSQQSNCLFSLNEEFDDLKNLQNSQDSIQRRKLVSQLCYKNYDDIKGQLNQRKRGISNRKYRDQRIKSFPSDETTNSKKCDQDRKSEFKYLSRTSASSKVNFALLTEEEQIARYKNTRLEYLALKKKMDAYEHSKNRMAQNSITEKRAEREKIKSKEDSLLIQGKLKVHQKQFQELADCGQLLENLASSLSNGVMKPDSLEFSLLCNLVRKVKLGISSKEGLSLMTQANQFLKREKRQDIVQFIKNEKLRKQLTPVKPTPIYSSSPISTYPMYNKHDLYSQLLFQKHQMLGPIRAELKNNKVKIILQDTNVDFNCSHQQSQVQ